MKLVELLLLGICSFLLVSCQSTSTGDVTRPGDQASIKSRINKNADQYSKLDSWQKKNVNQGVLKQGMSKTAARLAWGRPDKVENSNTSGGKKEYWIYYRREEVYLDNQSPVASLSRFYSGSEKYYDGHSFNNVRTVQREDRTVSFLNGYVTSWTRSRN